MFDSYKRSVTSVVTGGVILRVAKTASSVLVIAVSVRQLSVVTVSALRMKIVRPVQLTVDPVLTSIVATVSVMHTRENRVTRVRTIVALRPFAETDNATLPLGKNAKHAQMTVAPVKTPPLKEAFAATMSVTLGRIVRLVRMIVGHVL